MQPYWQRQTTDKPLFPNLQWSQPENSLFAGKLLILGGHAQTFARPAESFGLAQDAGIGSVRVMMPDVLQRFISKIFPAAEFAPSTPSGSFAQTALGEALPAALWADGVLLAGDFGRNSETAVMLETFSTKYSGQLTVTEDAVDYFTTTPAPILARQNTTFVLSFQQLQKLAQAFHFTTAFTSTMDYIKFIEALHILTTSHVLNIVIQHEGSVVVAVNGSISTTKLGATRNDHSLAACAAVWWLQNSSKPFDALTTSVICSK